jgi:AMMECR1 domain-containing protein
MDNILDYAICNIFDIPSFFISKEYLCDCIKIKDCFGIFVTIKRSNEYKLQEFPHDIHGCIGKFNYPFNILKKNILLDTIITCARSAAYDDSRREYFKNPLFLDSSATIELSFLILPSYDIDASSGIITEISAPYNNDDFGIIAINEDDNKIITTATFLPKVFDINTSWDEIKTLVCIECEAAGDESEQVDVEGDLLQVYLTPGAASAFATRSLMVVDAGRTQCPFCEIPIDPQGHLCPRANGYRR